MLLPSQMSCPGPNSCENGLSCRFPILWPTRRGPHLNPEALLKSGSWERWRQAFGSHLADSKNKPQAQTDE